MNVIKGSGGSEKFVCAILWLWSGGVALQVEGVGWGACGRMGVRQR